MDYNFNTLGVLVIFALLLFLICTIILFIENMKLNEELLPDRYLKDTENRKNEAKTNHLKKGKKELEKTFMQDMDKLKKEHSKNISALIERYHDKQSDDYKKAYEDGKNAVDFEIRVTPLKKVIDTKGIFSKNKMVEIGYSHQLYINGIPCFDQNDVITDRFSAKDINDTNIHLAIENISKILDIVPDKRAKMASSLEDFSKSVKKEAIA